MKIYRTTVELDITFEAENKEKAENALKTIIIDPKFSEFNKANLLNVEEQWGELDEQLGIK
jgi:hypothetical protein